MFGFGKKADESQVSDTQNTGQVQGEQFFSNGIQMDPNAGNYLGQVSGAMGAGIDPNFYQNQGQFMPPQGGQYPGANPYVQGQANQYVPYPGQAPIYPDQQFYNNQGAPAGLAAANSQIDAQANALEQDFLKNITDLRDFIAPSSVEFATSELRVGTYYARCLYVYGYPRRMFTGWMGYLVNLDEEIDLSIFIYPVKSQAVLESLKKKVAQIEANIAIDQEKGRVRDPAKEASIYDAEELRDKLQVGEEKFFRLGLYVACYAQSIEELDYIHHKVESILGRQLVYSKVASTQMEQAFNSILPQGMDELMIRRNMNTGALSTSFPFTSANLSQDNGILMGINQHNNGLVLFDRFSLENANMVVFAKSGAGKSFAVKLEALRSLMIGTEIIIIDPENEYETMCDAVGGAYINLSLNSSTRINPFDLPQVIDAEESDNILRANIITLHGLLRLMMGGQVDPVMEADLDQALIDTYAQAGITPDPATHGNRPPVMSDLYDILAHGPGTMPKMAQMIRKFVSGTFAGIFSQASNVQINNPFVVFCIRDLEDELRPIAMYIMLNYIWNKTKSDRRKRLLIVDEAWQLLKYPDAANFMFSVAKRARKYYLGLTTISQDVEDMINNQMGRAIVSNASMQLLLKQSVTVVDGLQQVFKLTNEEKKRLSQFPIGQGLLFAGSNHVHIKVEASPTETELISTSPEKLAEAQRIMRQAQSEANVASENPVNNIPNLNSNVQANPAPGTIGALPGQ